MACNVSMSQRRLANDSKKLGSDSRRIATTSGANRMPRCDFYCQTKAERGFQLKSKALSGSHFLKIVIRKGFF